MGKIIVSHNHPLCPGKGFAISSYLQDMVCFVGQTEVFSEAEVLLERLAGVRISGKQIERVCHHYGERLETESSTCQPIPPSGELHYAMADGAMVLTREKDEQGKSKWAEMKLGRIFKASDQVSMGSQQEARRWIKESKYVAHLGNCDDFYERFSVLLDPLPKLIFIADGARWIWDRVGDFHPNAIQILDFYHAMEHLCEFVELCCRSNFEDVQSKQAWLRQQKEALRQGKVSEVCQAVENLKVSRQEHKEKRNKLLKYYQSNAERMKYDEYLAKGWLIGSGPIESAHREVIQKRLKRSGQRWTKKGAQQIANLRVSYKNDEWENVRTLIKNAA